MKAKHLLSLEKWTVPLSKTQDLNFKVLRFVSLNLKTSYYIEFLENEIDLKIKVKKLHLLVWVWSLQNVVYVLCNLSDISRVMETWENI